MEIKGRRLLMMTMITIFYLLAFRLAPAATTPSRTIEWIRHTAKVTLCSGSSVFLICQVHGSAFRYRASCNHMMSSVNELTVFCNCLRP